VRCRVSVVPTFSLEHFELSHFLVTIPVEAARSDVLAAKLWGLGAVGIEELPSALRAAFTDGSAAERARVAFAPRASVERFGDSFGLDSARDLLTIEHAGGFAVHPPWIDAPPDGRSIVIDPGHAFGSGSHPSTRLALELLEDEVQSGDRVFDIGCGSGVLSIAAALLGASTVSVDIDPAAIAATNANALRNGVEMSVMATIGSADHVRTAVELVAINVTIDIQEALAPVLATAHPRLLVAGLLGSEQLSRCAAAHHATIDRSIAHDGWMAAVLARS
jgi:precorrin-6B methylase 2